MSREPLIQILRTPPAAPSAALSPVSSTVNWPDVAERLRGLAAARPRSSAMERCEFCGSGIDDVHGHLVDRPRRALMCVCRPCYLLFTHDGAGGGRFRAVPDRYAAVPELAVNPEAMDALQIPIGLAFFFMNSDTGRATAFYPSPAGATESELPLEAWGDVVQVAPRVGEMSADVEALLIRRTADIVEALIVPIDACYELVGRIRRDWTGFQGGDEVQRSIDEFFVSASARAQHGGR